MGVFFQDEAIGCSLWMMEVWKFKLLRQKKPTNFVFLQIIATLLNLNSQSKFTSAVSLEVVFFDKVSFICITPNIANNIPSTCPF